MGKVTKQPRQTPKRSYKPHAPNTKERSANGSPTAPIEASREFPRNRPTIPLLRDSDGELFEDMFPDIPATVPIANPQPIPNLQQPVYAQQPHFYPQQQPIPCINPVIPAQAFSPSPEQQQLYWQNQAFIDNVFGDLESNYAPFSGQWPLMQPFPPVNGQQNDQFPAFQQAVQRNFPAFPQAIQPTPPAFLQPTGPYPAIHPLTVEPQPGFNAPPNDPFTGLGPLVQPNFLYEAPQDGRGTISNPIDVDEASLAFRRDSGYASVRALSTEQGQFRGPGDTAMVGWRGLR